MLFAECLLKYAFTPVLCRASCNQTCTRAYPSIGASHRRCRRTGSETQADQLSCCTTCIAMARSFSTLAPRSPLMPPLPQLPAQLPGQDVQKRPCPDRRHPCHLSHPLRVCLARLCHSPPCTLHLCRPEAVPPPPLRPSLQRQQTHGPS